MLSGVKMGQGYSGAQASAQLFGILWGAGYGNALIDYKWLWGEDVSGIFLYW